MLEVKIPYTPRLFAREIHGELETHRFAVLVAHRRFGKTVLSINHLIKRAFTDKKERGFYAYIAPFLNQAEQIAWGYLKHYTEVFPNLEINQQKLRMTLPNGATIRLYGADNPDSLRGAYFDGVIIDEVAQIKPTLWGEVIRPALSDRKGWALFIGTPKGINLFSQMYDLALAKMRAGDPDWWCGLYPVNRTKIIDDDELRSLQDGMSQNEFRQEFMCDFNAAADNALIDIDLARNATTRVYRETDYSTAARVIGVDVARFGGDSSVIFKRQGLLALEPIILNKLDNMALADRVAREIEEWHPDAVFIDIGNGAGVVDYLRRIGQNCVVEVNFGSKASHDEYYANKRAEMWFAMRDWLKAGGSIPPLTLLQGDLCAPTYGYNPSGRRILEPKEKLKERIGRSPDCFVAGTLVLCESGNIPIEKINVGDRVYTPTGFVRVAKVWETTTEKLTEVRFQNGRKLVGKPGHKVVGAGYKTLERLDTLALGNAIASASLKEILLWNILNSLPIGGSYSDFKRRVGTTNQMTKRRRRDFYTGGCGRTTTALFLMGARYITKTVTGLITGLRIWNSLNATNTQPNICVSECKTQSIAKRLLNLLKRLKTPRSNGTHQTKEETGIRNMENSLGLGESHKKQCAKSAARSSILISRNEQDFVQEHVNRNKVTSGTKPKQVCARFAANRLSLTNIGIKNVVVATAQTNCVPPTKVFNLTLETENVYYANGILVENCADALALTFAAPVRSQADRERMTSLVGTERPYNAFDRLTGEWR